MLHLIVKDREEVVISDAEGNEVFRLRLSQIKHNHSATISFQSDPSKFRVWRGRIWNKVIQENKAKAEQQQKPKRPLLSLNWKRGA